MTIISPLEVQEPEAKMIFSELLSNALGQLIGEVLGETIELTVRASNRDCYASGALAATKFLAGKPAEMYAMNDVLGL